MALEKSKVFVSGRVKKVKDQLARHEKFEAMLVTKMENIRYISGYHGHDAWLLITARTFYLITDSRYTEEAEAYFSRLADFRVKIIYPRAGRGKLIKGILAKHRIKSLGFESMNLAFGVAQQLTQSLVPVKLAPVTNFVEVLRMIKEPQEIAAIEKAIALDEEVFRYLRRFLKPGISEAEIVRKAETRMRELGGDGPSYSTIVAAAAKAALPHARSDETLVRKNDMLLIDMGTTWQGYVSDLTRTFFLGRIPTLFRDRYSKVLEAQELAMKGLKPGLPIQDFEKKVRKFFSQYHVQSHFCHSLGHGIGLEVHELPWVNAHNPMLLVENMVITIEPGLYFPGWGGIRIEDDVLITKTGYRVLSRVPKTLSDMTLS